MLVNMGLFLGGFGGDFLVYFFGFLGIFNIIGVMRDVFWLKFELFKEVLKRKNSAENKRFKHSPLRQILTLKCPSRSVQPSLIA